LNMPQVPLGSDQISSPGQSWEVQIKNIKLHIVTDIKVNFNSMLGFRISIFGWGEGHFYCTMKRHTLWRIPGGSLDKTSSSSPAEGSTQRSSCP
jgi:hypothetical protein